MGGGELEQYARPAEDPDFFVNELRRASQEQLFGVADVGAVVASTPPSSPGATVNVQLLERRSIKIKLSLEGYRVPSILAILDVRVCDITNDTSLVGRFCRQRY